MLPTCLCLLSLPRALAQVVQILSSFSLSRVETSVALSIVANAYALVNYDSLFNFSVGLKGMSFQTMSMGSFPGGNSGASTYLIFICFLTIVLWIGL